MPKKRLTAAEEQTPPQLALDGVINLWR